MKYERLTKRAGWQADMDLTQEYGYSYIYQRLSEWENDYESGKAVKLPCKVGDTIWVVCGTISEYEITEFWYDGLFFMFKCTNAEYVQEHRDFSFFDERIGKTVFLTREEAEKRLEELQG